jgi:hypothetical protein
MFTKLCLGPNVVLESCRTSANQHPSLFSDRRKESKIMLKAESGSFNGNVTNKVGENFRKIKRKQEIEKFDTFMVYVLNIMQV